ncbi:MAG: STAS domain-containing protein [Hydrogenophilus sp.]|nr:STAS domain-containing protein [Hydrogenophilus sp.]
MRHNRWQREWEEAMATTVEATMDSAGRRGEKTGEAKGKKEGGEGIRVEGAMTIYRLPDLKREVIARAAAKKAVVFLLDKVSEVDTAAVQFLLWARRYAAAHGVSATVESASLSVLEAVSFFRAEEAVGWRGEANHG